ncbi:2-oxoacid:acceptor oxidoreductase subunit alpha [Aminobacterium mobile]|jgi:2-oxoglutarate ferredoxin oxidoreductase subunit alpha|uniref:2-oxoacid:acceptor oxidoreductase subunit alpha n=1 Tax=Aminobacterium mobile TaxID=81467 RepID=UPI0004630200|nr:2-oxoacid:acceptor oxidoreductase subunit alpha [Aminobacterium mobile]
MSSLLRVSGKDVSLVLCGAAGQGVQTVEELLVKAIRHVGYSVFASREYMSRVRGGNNSTEIRFSPWPVRAFVDRIDVLVPLSEGIRENVRRRISSQTLIIGDRNVLRTEGEELGGRYFNVEFLNIASEIGGVVFANFVAAGMLLGMIGGGLEIGYSFCNEKFAPKGQIIVDKNKEALDRGFKIGQTLTEGTLPFISGDSKGRTLHRSVLSGTEALSLGALAGGCTFIAAYPMSPATGVLSFMAQCASQLGVVVEQTEDELAAINMALGAGYAGARAMVTTSGGGFDLMTEGVSLAGIMEVPVVIHVGQRPGPATGMATRTEQGDLHVALYGGHGEFPRAVFAPATLEEAVRIGAKSFYIAEKYHIPVIILTDQYFLNSYYDMAIPDLESLSFPSMIVKSEKDYCRYKFSSNGISPRSVPGNGKGLIGADSHEHDEEGHVYEDFDLRKCMVDKRFRKLALMRCEAEEPLFVGAQDYRILIIGWGSTFHILEEALEFIGHSQVALMHFQQLYPLPASLSERLEQAQNIIVVEGNKTGQFAHLLRQETGRKVDSIITNYNGLQFSVEQIVRELVACLNEGVY